MIRERHGAPTDDLFRDDQLLRVFQHSLEFLGFLVLGTKCHRALDRALSRIPLPKNCMAQSQVVIGSCETKV